jgi:O-antigen/teichoic acid export membrane protein
MIKAFSKALLWKFSATAFQFLLGMVLAVFAGANIWGGMALMIAGSALFLLVSSMGADVSIVWHGSSGQTDSRQLLGLTYSVILRQLLIYLVILFFSIFWLHRLPLSNLDKTDWFFELFFILGLILTEKYTALFFSRQLELICNFTIAATNFTIIIAACLAVGLESIEKSFIPKFYCLAMLIQSLILAILFHIKTKMLDFNWPETSLRQSFYKFSLLIFAANLIQFLAYRMDFWMLEYYSGFKALGNYSQATRFVQLFWIIPQAAAALMLPSILHQKKEEGELFVWKLLKSIPPLVFILIGPFLMVVYILFHSILLEFDEAWRACLILLPGTIMFMISIIIAPFFTAMNQLKVNLKISAGCLLCIALLDLLLIPSMGVSGAALASTIGYGLSGLASFYMFRKLSISSGQNVSGWTLFMEIFSKVEK